MFSKLHLIFMVTIWCQTGNCSHFRGGIITWKPSAENQLEISYRVSFRSSFSSGHRCTSSNISNRTLLSGEGSLQCTTECSGTITQMSYYCTDFSEVEDWTTGTRSVIYNLADSTKTLFHFSFSSCCWISLQAGSGYWLMRTSANISKREDNGKINSSPISVMQPIVRFNKGCYYRLRIPVTDEDGDIVRCRWATKTPYDECGGVCKTLPGSVLNETTCNLEYNATQSLGWYAVALQIEDFISEEDTVPLSSVSLQFLIYVVSGNCTAIPELEPPSLVSDGSILHLQTEGSFEDMIIAKSISNSVQIRSIDTISPLGMMKSDLMPYGLSGKEWYVNVSWVPTVSDIGHHIFCYTAVDSLGQKSDQSCATIIVNVPTTTPEILTSSVSHDSTYQEVYSSGQSSTGKHTFRTDRLPVSTHHANTPSALNNNVDQFTMAAFIASILACALLVLLIVLVLRSLCLRNIKSEKLQDDKNLKRKHATKYADEWDKTSHTYSSHRYGLNIPRASLRSQNGVGFQNMNYK